MSSALAKRTQHLLKITLVTAPLTINILQMALKWEEKVAALLILNLKKWQLKILKTLKMEAITYHLLQQQLLQ